VVARLGARTGVCSDRRVDLGGHHYSGMVNMVCALFLFSMARWLARVNFKIMGTILKKIQLISV